jgi:hypothetical protein
MLYKKLRLFKLSFMEYSLKLIRNLPLPVLLELASRIVEAYNCDTSNAIKTIITICAYLSDHHISCTKLLVIKMPSANC